MTKKAKLAKFIMEGTHDIHQWQKFQPNIIGLRVKETGPNSEILISLDDTGWYRPIQWLHTYQSSILTRLNQELALANSVLPQDVILSAISKLDVMPSKPIQPLSDTELFVLKGRLTGDITQDVNIVMCYCWDRLRGTQEQLGRLFPDD